MEQHKSDGTKNDFATLFEKSLSQMESLQPGQLLETQIVSISDAYIFLQLSGKSEGILERAELTNQDGKLTVKEGDTIKVYFLQAKNGELYFTTRISGDKAGQAILENAYKNKIPVEGLVEKEIKGGYEIKIGGSRAFCPYSQMGLKRAEDSGSYVGKHLTFRIQEYKENGRNILVSNRIIEEESHQDKIESLKKTLHEHMTVKGTITSVQDFGAFVDVDGIQALLPISEIGRSRVDDIHTVLSIDQKIEAEIIKLDWQTERLTLSMKALLSDPWDTAREKYPKNSRHTGKVIRITDFGAFVTLEPGLDGLIHVSELRGTGKYNNVRDAVKIGQSVSVQILDVDIEKKRIALKQVSSFEEDETAKKYMEGNEETYNPFAALLKKNKNEP